MNDSLFPHYQKIKPLLNKKQIKLYKSLTQKFKKSGFTKDNAKIEVLKYNDRVFVFTYKQSVIKIIFNSAIKYKNELYYTYLFYHKIYSLSIPEACMLILPRFETDLKHVIAPRGGSSQASRRMHQLIFDLISQVFLFHENYIVHHDIKPSNIVKTKDFRWKIIDFGLTLQHKPRVLDTFLVPFHGTKGINIPQYNLDNTNELERCFWIYMKDWYGVSMSIEEACSNGAVFGVVDSLINLCDLKNFINEMKYSSVITTLKKLKNRFNITNIPYYLK